MIKASFKYDIGDVVTLIRVPERYSMHRCGSWFYKDIDEFSPKQYKIKGYSFTICESGSYEYTYSLDSYGDDWLMDNKWITEDLLEGTGTPHEEELYFKSGDGDDLNIGDIVYSYLYDNGISCGFTRKIKVANLSYVKDKDCKYGPVETIRGDILIDSRWNGTPVVPYGGIAPCNSTLKNATEEFLYKFAKTCKAYGVNPSNKREGDYNTRKFWLDELGVFDTVCEIYSSMTKKSSPKKSSGKDEANKKVSNILAGLNDEEKKEMLKLLNETYEEQSR